MHLNSSKTPVPVGDVVPMERIPTDSSVDIDEQLFAAEESLPPLFPTPKRSGVSKWLWLGLLASLGLHTGLMLIPTGEGPKPPPPKQQEKQVRITQLPKLVKTVNVPKPIKPTVKPVVRQTTTPPIPKPIEPPKPPQAISSPSQQNTPKSSAWDDFPIYPGAQPGCFGLASCLQTADSLSQIGDFYQKELPAKKYDFKPILKENGRQVFQVSRNGQTQILSVIQAEKGNVIVLSDAPRSLEDLKKAVEIPPEVAAILGNLDAQTADQSNFAQPELFYVKSTEKGPGAGTSVPKKEISNISLVPGYAFDTMMDEFFRNNLQVNDFEVTDLPQSYGGGKVYQIAKGGTKLYLNLVPAKGNSGTIVVTWKDVPK
jgi:hypothetical protein